MACFVVNPLKAYLSFKLEFKFPINSMGVNLPPTLLYEEKALKPSSIDFYWCLAY
jgi:hypothetical protein